MRSSFRLFFTRPQTVIAIIVTSMLVLVGVVAFTTAHTSATPPATITIARASATSPTTIWGDSKPTAVSLDQDKRGVELGTTFTPAADGRATAIRFYKLAGQIGVHTGSIWAPDGTRITTVTFKNESAAGWQTVSLPTPVALKSGTTYVVSYRVPAGGRYATTVNFAGKSESSFLRVSQRNSGVYSYRAPGTHPHSRWRSSQYWADLMFVPGEGSGGSSKPTSKKTATPSPSPTPIAMPTPSPIPIAMPAPSPKPTATPTPITAPPTLAPSTGFPTRASAGLPKGWQPTQQVFGDYYVRQAGALVQDLRITDGTIIIEAPNVTLRRIQSVGSYVVNGLGSTCYQNLLIEDSEFTPNGTTSDKDNPVIQFGGYTARNIVIDGAPEGLRVGGTDIGCGPVSVSDSFIRVKSPDVCTDWHGDGIQGYGGDKIVVRNTTIIMQVINGCYGTAPFFYPKDQGNTSVDIDGLLIGGSSGYPFRNGMPGSVKNLNIIDGSWVYAPVDVNCSVVTPFQAQVVKLNANGQPVRTGTSIDCAGEGN